MSRSDLEVARQTVKDLDRFFVQGWLEHHPAGLDLTGLVYPLEDGRGIALSQTLLERRARLSSAGEWKLALLSLDEKWRNPWLHLFAARCLQAGSMSAEDPWVLGHLITEIGLAAQWILPVVQSTEDKYITPSPLQEMELELLGHSLHENAAIPMLTRILNTGFVLYQEQSRELPVSTLLWVDGSGQEVDRNWCTGRLLALPGQVPSKEGANQVLLTEMPQNQGAGHGQISAWLGSNPWALLLALMVFIQDAWSAEHQGGLVLELPAGHDAYRPSGIEILIQGSEEEEVHCGTLGEFLIKLLFQLGIGFYPHTPSPAELNSLVSGLVGELLRRNVWQFQEDSRGPAGHYSIHPEFCDACYSLPLSKSFGRKSKKMKQAIRSCAQGWRGSRMAQAAAERII